MRTARLSPVFALTLLVPACEDPVSTPGDDETSGSTSGESATATSTAPPATESSTGDPMTDGSTGTATGDPTGGETDATETTGEQSPCPTVGSITISGTSPGQLLGWRVAMAGDFDGDGIGDYALAAPRDDSGFATDSGRIYLVRGGANYEDFDITDVGADVAGWVIEGEDTNHRAGEYLASGGDINGDGRDDLLIGSMVGAMAGAPEESGRVSIVYGAEFGSGASRIALADVRLGEQGIAIDGRAFILHNLGANGVAHAGDVNDDGFDDVLFGTPLSDGLLGGRADVIYGADDLTPIVTPDTGPTPGQGVGWSPDGSVATGIGLSGAGDVNGDGVDDFTFVAGGSEAAAYVMFGGEDIGTRTLDDVIAGVGGFRILLDGGGEFFPANAAISTIVGDVNNDGYADVVVGGNRLVNAETAPAVHPTALVIFGKEDTGAVGLLDVLAGTGGFVAAGNGAYVNGGAGSQVGPAGDMNADGIADWFFGAPGDPVQGVSLEDGLTGRVYVIYGNESGEDIDLDTVAEGEGGFIFEGTDANDDFGRSISAGNDVNGDGIPDIVVGMPQTGYVGAARVHFGFNDTCPRVE